LPIRIELKIDFSTVERSISALSLVAATRCCCSLRMRNREKIPIPTVRRRMFRMMTRLMRLLKNNAPSWGDRG